MSKSKAVPKRQAQNITTTPITTPTLNNSSTPTTTGMNLQAVSTSIVSITITLLNLVNTILVYSYIYQELLRIFYSSSKLFTFLTPNNLNISILGMLLSSGLPVWSLTSLNKNFQIILMSIVN